MDNAIMSNVTALTASTAPITPTAPTAQDLNVSTLPCS